MKDGFYWYRGSGEETFDPDEGWVIVRVSAIEVYFTGSEIPAYPGTELKGQFVGPILMQWTIK